MFRLAKVQRQTARGYREAIQHLRRDSERGFERLEEMGAVREVSWQDRAQAVQAYSEAQAHPNAKGQARSVLVVAATHEEIGHVAEPIRAERSRTGELGESFRLEHHVPLNWTTAHRIEVRNYREGQVLEFHRAVKGVVKNEALEVVRVQGKHRMIAAVEELPPNTWRRSCASMQMPWRVIHGCGHGQVPVSLRFRHLRVRFTAHSAVQCDSPSHGRMDIAEASDSQRAWIPHSHPRSRLDPLGRTRRGADPRIRVESAAHSAAIAAGECLL